MRRSTDGESVKISLWEISGWLSSMVETRGRVGFTDLSILNEALIIVSVPSCQRRWDFIWLLRLNISISFCNYIIKK